MTPFAQAVHEQTPTLKPMGSGKFGAQLATYKGGVKGILKLQPFTTEKYRGVSERLFPVHEVAAYRLDKEILGFDVVPETVLTELGGRVASVQEFKQTGHLPRELVPGIFNRDLPEWKEKIAKLFSRANLDDMLRIVVLDLVINNADRHGRNILIDPIQERVWAIDNGLAFGSAYVKYRCIFHKYLFYAQFVIPTVVIDKLAQITRADLNKSLKGLLVKQEREETWWRIQFIIQHQDRLAYKRMSAGKGFENGHFPTYEEWFRCKMEPALVYSPQARIGLMPGDFT